MGVNGLNIARSKRVSTAREIAKTTLFGDF